MVVLLGEPGVRKVKIDAGGIDVAVPGLSLHRLERHASLTETGQTSVAQHVAGQMVDAGASTGATDDLVDTRRRQRLPPARSLEDDEHTGICGVGGSFVGQVRGQCREESRCDRDDTVMSAFHFGDRNLPVGHTDVDQLESENFTAAQAA